MESTTDVLIVGGGFAGAWSAMAAARRADRLPPHERPSIRLVSREPLLTVRPRLYERDLTTVQVDLRPILDSIGVELTLGDVVDVCPQEASADVRSDGANTTLRASSLVLCTGSQLVRDRLPTTGEVHDVDSMGAARAFRSRLASLGRAAHVAIVGAGLAGLELATELADEGHRVSLIDRNADPGATFGRDAWAIVAEALDTAGVACHFGVTVVAVDEHAVSTSRGDVEADLTVLTSGLRARTDFPGIDVPRDALGRLVVGSTLAIPGSDAAFAAGDVAHAAADGDRIAPMACQTAIPMGVVAGTNAVIALTGGDLHAFAHEGYVTCMDLGAAGALFTMGWDRVPTITGAEAKVVKREIVTEAIVPDPATFGSRRLIA